MANIDPSYPLYPIACILSAAMLLLVLLTSFVRQSWNLSVAFLCFWLFWENLTFGIDTVIWSTNADVKLYVYCDIVTHVQVIASVVKPMATLMITRRLYLITSSRSVEPTSKTAKRRDVAIEWALGLVIPVLVAGPLLVQASRFQVFEGFGCESSLDGSILFILLLKLWIVAAPLVSVVLYYPKVARHFYRHSRAVNHFLRSNDSMSRPNYFRILSLASIDSLLTLPMGIVTIVLAAGQVTSMGPISFYYGWTFDHTDWQPEGHAYARTPSTATVIVVGSYFQQWTSPFLAFVIFGLFGVTSEARASYWKIICRLGGWFGWKPTPRSRRARSPLGEIEFSERPPQTSMSLSFKSQPSCINREARMQDQSAEYRSASGETDTCSVKDGTEEVRLARAT